MASVVDVKYLTAEEVPTKAVFADYWREVMAPTLHKEVLKQDFFQKTVNRFESYGFNEDDSAEFIDRTFANWGERMLKLQEISENPVAQTFLKDKHGIDITSFNLLALLKEKIIGKDLNQDEKDVIDILSQLVVGKGIEFGGETSFGLAEDINLFSDWKIDVIVAHEMTHYLISKKYSYLEDIFAKLYESANDLNPYGGVTKQYVENMMIYVALGNEFQEAVAHSNGFVFLGNRDDLIKNEDFGSYKDKGSDVRGIINMVKYVRENLGKIYQENFDGAVMLAYGQFEEEVKKINFNESPEGLLEIKSRFFEKFYDYLKVTNIDN